MRSGVTVRIYLACLVLVLVVSASLDVIRRKVMEPSQQRGTLQLARLVAAMAGEAWSEPDGLDRQALRLRKVLDADVTVFALDGSVVETNRLRPASPLDEEDRVALLASDEVRLILPRTAAAPIRVNGTPVGYLLLTPLAPARDVQALLLTLGLIILLVGAASVLLARSIARPLSDLTRVARSFGSGDLSARARLRRSDEFGELGGAFDEMADRIAKLVRAQKELLANVSHELRTPLSRLRVALDLALEKGDQRRQELLTHHIQGDLAELEQLLTDVLVTARLDLSADRATGAALPFKKSVIEARDVLEAAAARFEKAHPERRLQLEIDGALGQLDADSGMLRRALDNLLANAVRYSERSKPVILRACCCPQELMIDVVDEGVGIGPEDLPHVFEPFYRADRSRSRAQGGVGLGLVLARRIVEAHGGSISVDSVVDRGTTMRILLPVTGDAAERASA